MPMMSAQEYENSLRRLDLVVLTDPSTRLAGVVPVLERYEVDQMLYDARSCQGVVCRELDRVAEERGIAVHDPVDGLSIELDGITLSVRSTDNGNPSDPRSAVLRLVYGETSFLLAGGAGPETVRALAASGAALGCDVRAAQAAGIDGQALRDNSTFGADHSSGEHWGDAGQSDDSS